MVAYGDTSITAGAKLIDTQPIDAWKKYLAFHIASDNANYLTKAFDDASFEFFNKTLSGRHRQTRSLETRRPPARQQYRAKPSAKLMRRNSSRPRTRRRWKPRRQPPHRA